MFLTWDRTCLLSLLGDFYGARLLYGENVSEYCSTEKWAGEGDVVVKWRGTLPPCTKSLAQAGQPNQHAPALAFPLPTFRSSDSLCRPATLLVYLACDAQIFTRTPHLSPYHPIHCATGPRSVELELELEPTKTSLPFVLLQLQQRVVTHVLLRPRKQRVPFCSGLSCAS